jgi:hypothetical protein
MNMNKVKQIVCFLSLTAIVVLGSGLYVSSTHAKENKPSMYEFDDSGNLKQPKGYREWIFVGSPLTPNDMNNGKAAFPEFHHVYIPKEHFAVYKRTGAFPDGTILVKELLSVGKKQAPSGKGYFNGDFIGLEATVKDTKRFKEEPGNWAYFSFTTPIGKPHMKTAKAMSKNKCNFCHQAFAKDDWVFTQYYPVLKAAKPGRK